MIKTHSDDPDIAEAASHAIATIHDVLNGLPKADTFDYGGHELQLDEYGLCMRCTVPIAEAQQASHALQIKAESIQDSTIAEHLQLAAELLRLEAEAAKIRAELHSGHQSEPIINALLGYIYERGIHDSYDHTHKQDIQ